MIGPKGKDFILEKEAELQGGGRGAKIVLIMGVAFSFVSSVAIIGKLKEKKRANHRTKGRQHQNKEKTKRKEAEITCS